MRVYFAGSITGGREDVAHYKQIISMLSNEGFEVLTEHVGDAQYDGVDVKSGASNQSVYEQDLAWLNQAEVLIAEATRPSLGVGYEIAKAEELGKPVIVLFRPKGDKKLSAMIAGNPKLHFIEYQIVDELKVTLTEQIRSLQ